MSEPTRPVLRWHGGKWLLAPWIIAHLPPHDIYVQPFGGAWSVGMRKPRARAEIWNDLDGELVNLFRVLRDAKASAELVEALRLTPYSRDEFYAAYAAARGRVERARRLIVRSFMGHGADGASGVYRTGFRVSTLRRPEAEWATLPDGLELAVKRLKGVVIESRPALQVMQSHDGPATLHFVDPPYLHETRIRAKRRPDNGGVYRHELTNEQHVELLAALQELRGMVVLSGYPSALYDDLLGDWKRVEREAMADGALPRTEVLWINPAARDALSSGPLFGTVAA